MERVLVLKPHAALHSLMFPHLFSGLQPFYVKRLPTLCSIALALAAFTKL